MFSDAEAKASTANITADDCVWLGEDLKLNPDKLLKERGYEPESALRLILGAIIDAHELADGPSRSARIDLAEEALLGLPQKRGKDPRDDEDMLRELGRRYFRMWLEDPDHEIEIGPIAKEVLADARGKNHNSEHSADAAARRLQRKFVADRDRILARATVELKWDLPAFHYRILRILEELTALGVACDTQRIIRRIDPKVGKSAS